MLGIGLTLSAGFVVAAVAAFALGTAAGRWAGLHLALAGAALVAVGTFMPHFGITLAGTAPARSELRVLGIAALAIGALLAVGGVLMATSVLVLAAAASLWLGLAMTAWVTFTPARQPLARRHPIAQFAYATALVEVALGIGLAAAYLTGYDPAAWSRLKPAHVWLNLFGFVSLTITATLVYLYPTIAGARIRFHPSLPVMVGGAMAGPPLVAAGAIAGLDPVASAGAIVTLAGAGGQLVYLIDVHRRRGGWTTDSGWHRASELHLLFGAGWYLAAVASAALGVLRDGLPPGWGLGVLAVPLVAGWVIQVLVGSATYLVPGVAVAEPTARADARALLGRASPARLTAWNVAAGVAWLGLATGAFPVALAGVGLFSLAAIASVVLLLAALARA